MLDALDATPRGACYRQNRKALTATHKIDIRILRRGRCAGARLSKGLPPPRSSGRFGGGGARVCRAAVSEKVGRTVSVGMVRNSVDVSSAGPSPSSGRSVVSAVELGVGMKVGVDGRTTATVGTCRSMDLVPADETAELPHRKGTRLPLPSSTSPRTEPGGARTPTHVARSVSCVERMPARQELEQPAMGRPLVKSPTEQPANGSLYANIQESGMVEDVMS